MMMVRVAMTVLEPGELGGNLATAISEDATDGQVKEGFLTEHTGNIRENWRIGASVVSARTLKAKKACSRAQ
jgi:hypothetical protein